MKPLLRSWVVLLLGAIVFVWALFWVRANYAELQKKDPLTEAQESIEEALGMRVAKESGPGGGLPVEAVEPGGPAEQVGLAVGDRIMALGDRSLWHVYQFADLINSNVTMGRGIMLLVQRDGEYRMIVFRHRTGPVSMPHAGHTHH